jgi:hypothetical protein
MPSPLRLVLATLLLASAGCSGAGSTGPDLASNARPVDVITETAPTPSASCTWTANGNGTYTGVLSWSKITAWGWNFWNSNSATQGVLTHPSRSGSTSYSQLTYAPTGAYVIGRLGQVLLTVSTCSG